MGKRGSDADHWLHVRSLFDQLVTLEPSARAERLDQIGSVDPSLRSELESLLTADARADDALHFLDPSQTTLVEPPAVTSTVTPSILLRLGQTVSHFRIVELLGSGGMGVVYRAHDTQLGRTVALKFLSGKLGADPAARQRLLREARAGSALDHQNICTVHEVGETEDGQLFIAMALYEGETLKARLARLGTLTPDDAVAIAKQVARGLAHAHRAGLVHRDLKPANLVITAGGVVKILDFGLASPPESGTADSPRGGTISYMAPEQLVGTATDGRTDLWALGIVLYEMLTGRRPFQANGSLTAVYAALHEEVASPRSIRPEIAPALEAAVLKLLKKDPAQRYPHADALLEELEALSKEAPLSRRRHIKTRPVVLAGALFVLIAGALGVWRWEEIGFSRAPVDNARVLVLPFRVSGDSTVSYLREGIVDLISARLAGETGVRAVSPQAAISAWRRGSKSTAGEDLAMRRSMRVARSVGAGQLLLGSVISTGARVAVTATLIRVPSGDARGSMSVDGPADSIMALVDRLATQILASGASEDERHLAALTSTSLPAVRSYLAGMSAYRRGQYAPSIAHLARALDSDSTFALAALWLRVIDLKLGGSEWPRATRLAWAARDRLSANDQVFLLGLLGPNYPRQSTHRNSLDQLALATKALPDRAEVWHELSDAELRYGDFASIPNSRQRAYDAARQALVIDPDFAPALAQASVLASMENDLAAARRYAARYIAVDSSAPLSGYLQWRIARVGGDRSQLRFDHLPKPALLWVLWASQLEGLAPDDGLKALAVFIENSSPDEYSDTQTSLHDLVLNMGRQKEALRAIEQHVRFRPARRGGPSRTRPIGMRARVDDALYGDGDSLAAALAVHEIEAEYPADVAAKGAVVEWRLARGDTTGARQTIAQGRAVQAKTPALASTLWYPDLLEAMLADVQRWPDVKTRINRIDEFVGQGFTVVWGPSGEFSNLVIARLQERQGNYQASLAAARRRWYVGRTAYLSSYLLQEARMAERTGDRDGAIRAYRHYLKLRSAPDSALVEKVNAVRNELARLEALK